MPRGIRDHEANCRLICAACGRKNLKCIRVGASLEDAIKQRGSFYTRRRKKMNPAVKIEQKDSRPKTLPVRQKQKAHEKELQED